MSASLENRPEARVSVPEFSQIKALSAGPSGLYSLAGRYVLSRLNSGTETPALKENLQAFICHPSRRKYVA
jgi:hypothetical protein